MQTFIVSDLHLGVKQCRVEGILRFLDGLPKGARLILNGDVITHFYSDKNLSEEHSLIVDRLREESFKREVIWIHGNNDKYLELSDPGKITFANEFSIEKRLYITHGHRFDWMMPSLRGVLVPIRLIYGMLSYFRKSKMHVAEFAKRFTWLYKVLCRHVAWNAVRYARRHGYEAVTCGHTHFMEDRTVKGVRYLNTGCWTESNSATVVIVDDDGIRMVNC
jgi:UDP-2,3-diacylglucosamine pyrophosphatase LpxH